MAIKANIIIDQGATFISRVNITDENNDPLDITGCTASAEIRKWYSSLNPVATFATNTSVNASLGIMTMELTADQTANIEAGRYVYDIKLYNPTTNVSIRVVEGVATITPQVTRTTP